MIVVFLPSLVAVAAAVLKSMVMPQGRSAFKYAPNEYMVSLALSKHLQ